MPVIPAFCQPSILSYCYFTLTFCLPSILLCAYALPSILPSCYFTLTFCLPSILLCAYLLSCYVPTFYLALFLFYPNFLPPFYLAMCLPSILPHCYFTLTSASSIFCITFFLNMSSCLSSKPYTLCPYCFLPAKMPLLIVCLHSYQILSALQPVSSSAPMPLYLLRHRLWSKTAVAEFIGP